MGVKEKRTAIANELINWLVARGETKGQYTYYVVRPFAEEKGYEMSEVWKAWDILRDSKRIIEQKGRPGWELKLR